MKRHFKLSRDFLAAGESHEVIYVSKKHGTMYTKSGSGHGMDFNHPIKVDLNDYEEQEDNLLYRIYRLKKESPVHPDL